MSESKVTHYMNLHPQPFNLIANGTKTIELRLYDEKRKTIKVGDKIVFSNSQNEDQQLCVLVKALHIYSSFEQLYKKLPLDKCGYLPSEVATASPKDMEMYYSAEKQNMYGVLGIEIQVIKG